MKFAALISFFLLLNIICFAQAGYQVKGIIADSVTNVKLENASISVLNAKDSILRSFTRAAGDGSFTIPKLQKGKYILLVTYPDYADYTDRFTLDSVKTEINFKRINMTLKSRLLQEVLIKAEKATMKIKGDTTEFDAGAFKVQPNAKVEDLLKRLPGIQIDKDGKITAQGQTINKVLVDGEEFFGDDPTLVTKNLRADMIDKVQLYDKKSDQAAFTGIDDGKKEKTINLKLKEDKKNGYFGKASGGIGTGKYYESQLAINAFKAKQKLSIYGTLANTGKTGLGWQDAQKYGTGDTNVEYMDGGGISISYDGGQDELDSFDGRYNGEGIPTARTGGIHYDTKWGKDNQSLNTNYKLGYISLTGTKNILSQNNLPTGLFTNNNDQSFNKNLFKQKLDATYNNRFDTTSTLKVIGDVQFKNGHTVDGYNSSSVRGNDVLLNQSNRNIDNNTDGKTVHANVLWNKKLKKKGRTLSFSADESYDESTAHGTLTSTIKYYGSTGLLDSTQNINQFKTSDVKTTSLKTNLVYTEPLAKKLTLSANYGVSINNSTSDRRSFNPGAGGYTKLDTTLSNDYRFNQLFNQGGLILNYKSKNATINFGTKAAAVQFKQTNIFNGSVLQRDFVNWNPQANFQYKLAAQSFINVSYNGTTQQPSITQIQPVRVNTDPLNIQVGNANLRPSFNNRFVLNYNSYKVLTDQYIGIYANYNFTSNPIVSNTTVDSAGKSTYQSINYSKASTNYYFGVYTGRKIKFLGINAGINANGNGNTGYNIINGAVNLTQSETYDINLQLNKYKEKKYDFYLSGGPNFNVSKSSLQTLNNNGHGINAEGGFNIYLPFNLRIGSDGNYQYRGPTASFNQPFERFVLNGRITKAFNKQETFKLSLAGYDLLNQNKGFDRSATNNVLTQTTYTNVKRYFMLTFSWDFNKVGGGAAPKK